MENNPVQRLEEIRAEIASINLKIDALDAYRTGFIGYGDTTMDQVTAGRKFCSRQEKTEAESEINSLYAEFEAEVIAHIGRLESELIGREDELKVEAKNILDAAQQMAEKAKRAAKVAQKAASEADENLAELEKFGGIIGITD